MRASGFTSCPVDQCRERPSPWFCSVHWPKVSSEVRRRIIAQVKKMNGKGLGGLPSALRELIIEGVREAMK